jgi:hypothetical protein
MSRIFSVGSDMCASDNRSDATFARACSLALQTCFALLEPSDPFPSPWQGISPTASCRKTIVDPASFLEVLRGAPAEPYASLSVSPHRLFDDCVLRAVNILIGPAEEPRLHPWLCVNDQAVFAVRDPQGRYVVDLLTPLGLLSGKLCGAFSVLRPEPGEPFLNRSSVLATTYSKEAALLLSLGFPVALLHNLSRASISELRTFWQPCWTAVPGCLPLIDRDAASSRPADMTPTSLVAPDVLPDPSAIHEEAHQETRRDNPLEPPPDAATVSVDVPVNAPVNAEAATADGLPVERGTAPAACDAMLTGAIEPASNDLERARRLPAGLPMYGCDSVIGGSLILLSETVQMPLTHAYSHWQDAVWQLNADVSFPAVLVLDASTIAAFRGLLRREYTLEDIQEEIIELELVSRQRPEEVWPSLTEKFAVPEGLLTVGDARAALLQALAEVTSANFKQQAYDRFQAAVDRDVCQPLRDAAAGERHAVTGSLYFQYAEAVRIATIIEPFAVRDFVPRTLRIDVPFDRNAPLSALTKQRQLVLTLSKSITSQMKRR